MFSSSIPKFFLFVLGVLAGVCSATGADIANSVSKAGAAIRYQLPVEGPLPRTYRVTLAIVDPKNPDWVISNFLAGAPRTVTAENKGAFTEKWDGLDDNYMPVPAGTYAVKGIYMPAEKWKIDGEYHSLIPRLASSGNSWAQSPAEDTLPQKIGGDSVSAPFRAVNVTPEGKGVLLFQYLENDKNNYPIDFTKPIGYGQISEGFNSGSAAGGFSVCTDGETIWSACSEGGPKFIYRPDGQPFGTQDSAGRHKITLPEGWVTAMAAWKGEGKTVVFVAERGKIIQLGPRKFGESDTEFVDKIVALDGTSAKVLAEWKMERPLGLAVRNGKLFAVHRAGEGFEVETLALGSDLAQTKFAPAFTVPAKMHPFDIAADSRGRLYLSDPEANHVYQLDSGGKLLHTYGRLDTQKDGAYDPESFMSPEKIAAWTDAQGKDRLLIVEQGGPNRMSEWDSDGAMVRQWVTPQLKSNGGYAPDPRHPDRIYMPGQEGTIVRWKINYETGDWTTEAVWQNAGTQPFKGHFVRQDPVGTSPKVLYHGDDLYIAFAHAHNPFMYRLEGDHFRACMAVFLVLDPTTRKATGYLWRDVDGDGKVEDNEIVPFDPGLPHGTISPRAFGDTWANDFSYLAIGQATTDVWQLPCTGFDAHGTPIYDPQGWKKLLTDDVFAAKQAGNATALRGTNEVGTSFSSDWSSVVPAGDGGYYVSARSGPNLTANFGTQYKLSRYVPDGKGGLVQQWRVGRMAIQHNALPGEVYGPIFVSPPVSGLVGVVDNSRAGLIVYTEDGLYVDTLMADNRLLNADQRGAYMVPGEFFTGFVYPNKDNGKVYVGLGKTYPEIYEVPEWTTKTSPVRPIETIDKTVSISSSQMASPPEIALKVRGGASASKVGFFYPASGVAPALDGSMDGGWVMCDPVRFTSGGVGEQNIEVRCLYDPGHIYLRWHARLGHPFVAKQLLPSEHLFAHDRQADTLSFYLQCDPNAPPGGKAVSGRPGDVRFVFGLFTDKGSVRPVALGMYPQWNGPGGAKTTYNTDQTTSFAHVGLVADAQTGYQMDADGKGYVLAAAIPRTDLPGGPSLDGFKTTGNFDANLGGANRFWWSNADGSANRDVNDEPTEARLFPGCWSSMQFLAMENLPIRDWMVIGPFGDAAMSTLDHQKDGNQIIKLLWGNKYPPDTTRDFGATYEGDMTQTPRGRSKLKWMPVSLSNDVVDFKSQIKWDASRDEGVAFLVTHIHAAAPVVVKLQTNNPHGRITFIGQLNGQMLPADPQNKDRIDPDAPLNLKAGWNELVIRYNHFYGTHEFGASLKADPAELWKLQIKGAESKGD